MDNLVDDIFDDELVATGFSQISALTDAEGLNEIDVQLGEKVLQKWEEDPTYKTRRNSPGKKQSKSQVWNSIKRLCQDHPLADKYTHTCILPNCPDPFMTLLKPSSKSFYTTTKAINHIRIHHKDAPENASNIARSKTLHVSIK